MVKRGIFSLFLGHPLTILVVGEQRVGDKTQNILERVVGGDEIGLTVHLREGLTSKKDFFSSSFFFLLLSSFFFLLSRLSSSFLLFSFLFPFSYLNNSSASHSVGSDKQRSHGRHSLLHLFHLGKTLFDKVLLGLFNITIAFNKGFLWESEQRREGNQTQAPPHKTNTNLAVNDRGGGLQTQLLDFLHHLSVAQRNTRTREHTASHKSSPSQAHQNHFGERKSGHLFVVWSFLFGLGGFEENRPSQDLDKLKNCVN